MTHFDHPYLSEAYARTFSVPVEPVYLPASRIWVLKRPIAGTAFFDASGCYPLTPLILQHKDKEEPWAVALEADRNVMAEAGILSLVMVTDVFYQPERAELERMFDHAKPFKPHYLRDLTVKEDHPYTKHHRYEIRRSLRSCEIRAFDLSVYLPQWCAMYELLIERHQMTGVQAFKRDYFEKLCKVSTLTAVGAFVEGQLVSAHLWLEHEGHVYSHLAASSEKGYEIGAAYPIYDFSIRHYAEQGAKWMDFGGGAGTTEASQGLARFKEGFSTEQRTCFIAGLVVDQDVYRSLSASKENKSFFPAYRAP